MPQEQTIPLRSLLERNDYTVTINYTKSLPNSPSRSKFNTVVEEWSGGAITDGVLPKTVAFRLRDKNGKGFFVHYEADHNEYWFEKATVRG